MCGSPPSAPQLPSYPGLTPDETNILSQQGLSLQQFNAIINGGQSQLTQNQNILQGISGLYNPDGSINQTALSSLQQRTSQAMTTQSGAGQSMLNSVASMYGAGGVGTQMGQVFSNALQGNVPTNQALQYQNTQNFAAMKEQAAQQGIIINGDDWNSATSDSTAGQKLIQNFSQNASIAQNNYSLGFLQTAGQNMQALTGTASTLANTGSAMTQGAANYPLGLVSNAISQGPMALSPLLSQYQTGLQNYYQPYYMQQVGPYQQQMAQQQMNYTAGLNQYNASQNQMMGWANLAANGATKAYQTYAFS
jgi:hypothetical protein